MPLRRAHPTVRATLKSASAPRTDEDRPAKFTLSDVDLYRVSLDPLTYAAQWYDYTGREFEHVTGAWLADQLRALTSRAVWDIEFRDHGNGHRSMTACVGREVMTQEEM